MLLIQAVPESAAKKRAAHSCCSMGGLPVPLQVQATGPAGKVTALIYLLLSCDDNADTLAQTPHTQSIYKPNTPRHPRHTTTAKPAASARPGERIPHVHTPPGTVDEHHNSSSPTHPQKHPRHTPAQTRQGPLVIKHRNTNTVHDFKHTPLQPTSTALKHGHAAATCGPLYTPSLRPSRCSGGQGPATTHAEPTGAVWAPSRVLQVVG